MVSSHFVTSLILLVTAFALIHKELTFREDFPLKREFLLQGCFKLHHVFDTALHVVPPESLGK